MDDAQVRKKALYRAKLNANKLEKCIESPLVRYNEFDQHVSRVCDVVFRSESLWSAHQASHKHHEVINNDKANAAGLTLVNSVKADSPVELPKPKPEPQKLRGSNPEASTELPKVGSSVVPPGFFDNNEPKRQKTGMNVAKLGNPNSYNKPGGSAQTQVAEPFNSESKIDTLSGAKVVEGKTNEILPDRECTQISKIIAGSETKQAKGPLPEGFFDDEDADLRAHAPVKLDVKMDLQTQGDVYTNLLQGGSNLSDEFMMESSTHFNEHAQVAAQESQFSPQIEPTAKKSQRGSNFTMEEDNLLILAWLNTSLDAMLGNELKHKTYWSRIWEYFHKYRTFNSNRNQNSLMNRWSTIQLGTYKFCRYFAQIESTHQSGVTELEKIYKARLMYQEFQKTSFQFEHCWNVLRCEPKWLEECEKKKPKRSKASTSSPSTPESIHLGEDDISHDTFVELERPLGTKAEKEQLNKQQIKNCASSNFVGLLNKIMEEKKKVNEKEMEILEQACLQEQEQNHIKHEIEQKRLCIEQEKLQMERLKEEERIIMMDTSGLSPMQKEYYHYRQMEILESRRRK
ncbi:hypothetical protein CsSME_00002423 [Camellia sinensis var. sinensis]